MGRRMRLLLVISTAPPGRIFLQQPTGGFTTG
jgi:hypothetical protein